jgi:uncharacterized protein
MSSIITQTADYVRKELYNAESGHDWQHTLRVWNNAKHIAEEIECNLEVVELAALLHDIADSKFHEGNEDIGPQLAEMHLRRLAYPEEGISHVVAIIRNISFKGGNEKRTHSSIELDIVQDADRLDALGAIGIARTFNYGGFKNRAIYDPDIKPNLQMTKEQYKSSTAPTINHFYEKLLLLKDRMNTTAGRKIALKRHHFMMEYLEQFFAEYEGKR